jgi:hypothetical protein
MTRPSSAVRAGHAGTVSAALWFAISSRGIDPDRAVLKTLTAPVGPGNLVMIERLFGAFWQVPGSIVCGWGRTEC